LEGVSVRMGGCQDLDLVFAAFFQGTRQFVSLFETGYLQGVFLFYFKWLLSRTLHSYVIARAKA